MSDPIERQDAINEALKCRVIEVTPAHMLIDKTEMVTKLLALPSIQPEQAVKDCRNCKYGKYNDHWETHFCYNPNECTEWNLWEPSAQPDDDRLERCRFEYVNACKIIAHPTPDTSKSDIYDAHALIKALHPIFGDVEF